MTKQKVQQHPTEASFTPVKSEGTNFIPTVCKNKKQTDFL